MKRKLIDVEAEAGRAEFERMAAKSDAYSRGRGLGKASDADLLRIIAFNLTVPQLDPQSVDPEDPEYTRHHVMVQNQNDLKDATVLREFARAPSRLWKSTPKVLSILERLAKQGDAGALELTARTQGDRGLYEELAKVDYYMLHAQERERDALEYKQEGNTDAERLATEVARLSRQLADVLRGEGDLRPRKERKQISPRKAIPRRLLEEYEKETAGMAWKSPQERAVRLRLAAKHGMNEKNYRSRILRAKIARSKSPTGATAKRRRDDI